ncbi:electron transport complex subunit RsxC [Hydrogenoanaerobacterium saccharovorans]|uniref:Ion-translocating oxidoreductase complex subunit C n=2 Tax=Hydrogenoanaerobacterium saccharovorans TaxID=474960 RepID=A0ABS2GKZ1_9FIRM|nr:electron transport complex subunit RsxC [Hydrogenoanaerobacterium saccharovorans]
METVKMPVPDKVVIPMKQHMGRECTPTVKLTDLVKVGQIIGDTDAFIGAPIHSSVSGKVTKIDEIIGTDGNPIKAVEITTDKLQEIDESVKVPEVTDLQSFAAAIRASGLVGLGGAGFPTHVKLMPKNLDEVTTLLVNGAECEPYITADNRAMLEDTDDIVEGIKLVKKYMNLSTVIIGIEDNKPQAIAKLQAAVADIEGASVKALKAQYPQGGEKVLIYECTGKIVPEGKLPSDVGCVVMNVSSIAFVAKYMRTGMPLITKRLTVDGDAIAEPKNVEVAIGTSFSDVIDFCGGFKTEPKKIIMGGPMMGFAVPTINYPVLKNNNAILAFSAAKTAEAEKPETPCIRCARCVNACPFSLMPAAIEKAYKAGNVDALKALKVNLCMECGCCAYVCPAKRNLVSVNRLAKKMIVERSK